jgi:flagellar motor protein MotB
MLDDRITNKEEDALDFNFWPSFADLMLALVLILVLIIFIVYAVFAAGAVNLRHVQDNQMIMVQAIATKYHIEPEYNKLENLFVIPIKLESGKLSEIKIKNGYEVQRLSFKDRVLFLPDEYLLSENGKRVLSVVGQGIVDRISDIREIQIQGHADTDETKKYPSNLHLAALRAIEVYNFLKSNVGIEPARYMMSATSFGEYKPVQRPENDTSYNAQRLFNDNSTADLKAQNRRIEILLFYQVEHSGTESTNQN